MNKLKTITNAYHISNLLSLSNLHDVFLKLLNYFFHFWMKYTE